MLSATHNRDRVFIGDHQRVLHPEHFVTFINTFAHFIERDPVCQGYWMERSSPAHMGALLVDLEVFDLYGESQS